MLGIIVGTVFRGSRLPGTERRVATPYGDAVVQEDGERVYLQRHRGGVPPRGINYRANVLALASLGVEDVIGVSSVGSLRKEIAPGSILVPHDYMSLGAIPTLHEREIKHLVPGFDERLRHRVLEAARTAQVPVLEHGVYVQTAGPRFETKAEVNFFKDCAHVVGMTLADEATLAQEAGLRYAGLCSVDNYAHGLGAISQELVERNTQQSVERILKILERL